MRRRCFLAAGSISNDVNGEWTVRWLAGWPPIKFHNVLVRLEASLHGQRLTAWQITEHSLYTTVL